MEQPTPTQIGEIVSVIQDSSTDIGLIMLAILTLLMVGFSMLMIRQSQQMNRVLPTPLSLFVRMLTWGYLILTVITFGLILVQAV